MESLRITPYVLFDKKRECLIITGRSSPENAKNFYDQINNSLTDYIECGASNIIANFNFEYYNTSSAKCLFGIFQKLKSANDKGLNVKVNWYNEEEDEDILECGEEYAEIIGMEFNYVEVRID